MFAILAFVLAVCALARPAPVAEAAPRPWVERLFAENFGFRREVMSQCSSDPAGGASSRQSVGFEVLQKSSSGTSTFTSFHFQGRMVRRDGVLPVQILSITTCIWTSIT